MNAECYVDPETKLPMAVGNTQLSYEEPPAGTFEIVIPDGYTVLDKRPGAPAAAAPDWLQSEETAMQGEARILPPGNEGPGTRRLRGSRGTIRTGHRSRQLGPFWLGSAYYGLGQYDLAIENFDKHPALHQKVGGGEALPYCHYARGLAYARLGMLDAGQGGLPGCACRA